MWDKILLEDYLGHMDSPSIDQLKFLRRVFKNFYDKLRPKIVCIAGITNGNEIECIDYRHVEKIIGIDINEGFLNSLKKRDIYRDHYQKFNLIHADLNNISLPVKSIDYVHCALILEFVDYKSVLRKVAGWLKDDGHIGFVLQMAGQSKEKISKTGNENLKKLKDIMNLVEKDEFVDQLFLLGLKVEDEEIVTVKEKEFFIGLIKKELKKES